MEPYTKIIEAMLYILPAYIANATPTLTKGNKPLDFNHKFVDGRPIFGKNKTIEGALIGMIAGALTSIALGKPLIGFSLTIGALLGDLLGAFIKRRLGKPPGSPTPILDQLDFLLGALLLSCPFFRPALEIVIILIMITPILHVTTNMLAYVLRIKNKPW